ncbi:NucA/NucB deoxyribonuclease domain-containing protein [Streptomyces sp. NPDC052000]|uniref:NucA/NucB deoxyribonuclease domain-containing protein n=1 Tax=Streptomyces sp. NPDC052000 TaxID=3155676 RepID=UPI003450D17F
MIKSGGILLAALLAVSTGLAGTANATSNPTPTPHRSAQIAPTKSPTLTTTTNVTCTTGKVTIDRTSSCGSGGLIVDFYIEPEHQYQGSAEFAWTSHVKLNPRNRYKYTDDVTLRLISSSVPEADLGEATVTETCGACTTTGGGTQITTPGTTRTWHLALNSPGRKVTTDRQAPHLTYTAAPYSPVDTDLGPKLRVRCDNTKYMGPSRTGGCVYPQVTPTYTISTTGPYNQVAWHIEWAQRNLQRHWGWRGHGPSLTRTMNQTLIGNNRDTACPKSMPRPAGKSCDEYPFASTYQGASKNADFSCHMVPERQNSNEGRARQTWYNSVRLFDGDNFWVDVTLPPANSPAAMGPLVQCP